MHFAYICIEMYIVTPNLNCFNEAIQMRGSQNMFRSKHNKNVSPNTLSIAVTYINILSKMYKAEMMHTLNLLTNFVSHFITS